MCKPVFSPKQNEHPCILWEVLYHVPGTRYTVTRKELLTEHTEYHPTVLVVFFCLLMKNYYLVQKLAVSYEAPRCAFAT